MANELALVPDRTLTPGVWAMINSMAPVMHQSRLFGVTSKEAAAAIMLKGFELGLPLTASFEFINVVEGRPTLSPRGALAIIQKSPELVEIKIEDILDANDQPVACRVWMKRRNGLEYGLTYTMDDARKSGTIKAKSAWETYPGNMLRWRTVGFVADVVFPDVIGGLKRADEFGANLSPDGDVIEGQYSVAPVQDETPAITLNDLLQMYSEVQIMTANGGWLPNTDEELAATAVKLAGA